MMYFLNAIFFATGSLLLSVLSCLNIKNRRKLNFVSLNICIHLKLCRAVSKGGGRYFLSVTPLAETKNYWTSSLDYIGIYDVGPYWLCDTKWVLKIIIKH